MKKIWRMIVLGCLLCTMPMAVACDGKEPPQNTDTTAEDTTAADTTNAETKSETPQDTGALRVMYYNVYGYGKLDSIPDRYKQQVAMIVDATPDVLCTQEFDSRHRENEKELLLEEGYAEVPVQGRSGCVYRGKSINCEAMFYRTDKLNLLESGGELYPEYVDVDGKSLYGNNGNTKSTTWAVFEQKSTGKIFLCVNTHFMWTDTQKLTVEEANTVRVDNAQRVLALIDRVCASKEEYADIPVIFGGDLNCRPNSDPYNLLCDSLTLAATAAAEYEEYWYYGVYATYDEESGTYQAGEPKKPDPEAEVINIIDHAFVKNMTVNSYLAVTEQRALITSDHLPWVVDVTLP